MSKNVVTRFAPSPTGFLHIGGVRTALFSYLFARQNKGTYILRIEDTDKARNKEEWTKGIIEDFEWLGMKNDFFAKQSERTDLYKKYIQKLLDSGNAYISKETPKEAGERNEVIRFKNPNKKVHFTDLIRGEIEIDTTDLGDFIIARSADEPLYHLTVVVDDFEMKVTHIIRAEEHISNTPRQILILEAIGAERPIYAHLPLVLAADKSKLSKRKHGEKVSLTYYRSLGYLPEGILNFVALMGWNPGTERELFSLDELISQFKIEKIQKSGAVFNVDKLNWINKQYIEKMDEKAFAEMAGKYLPQNVRDSLSPEMISKLLPLVREKISFFGEIPGLFQKDKNGELSFVFPLSAYPKEKLMWKQEKDIQMTKTHLKAAIDAVTENGVENLRDKLWPYAEKNGKGNVLWPMRFALSGLDKSPDPFILAHILGKDETLKRLYSAHQAI